MMLRRLDLARVFGRSLFLQAGFNPDSLQSLGLYYALEPALRRLYPDVEARQQVVRRYLGPFNTHPYVAAAILGGLLSLEARVATGLEPASRADHFKQTLQGPLAALGDSFFWRGLAPFVGAVSSLTVPVLGPWAALVFIVGYNVVHLGARAYFFWLGYTLGEGLVPHLKAKQLPMWTERLKRGAALCSAGLGAWLAFRFGAEVGGAHRVLWGFGALALGVASTLLAYRGASRYVALYFAAALAITLGALS